MPRASSMHFFSVFVLFMVSATASAGYDCRYGEPRSLDLDARGLPAFRLVLGSSEARV
jgi:hypothetical protein